jgi:hypothetical protein
MAYSCLRQNDQAVEDLSQTIRLDPHSASAFLSRGLIYSNEGKHESAISDFDQALALDSSLSEARQNKDFCQKELDKGKVAQQSVKPQADTTGGASGAGGSTASSASTTTNFSTSPAVQSASGATYTPYVGRGDSKLIAMQKEQKEAEARLYREKAEADRMATERARAEAKSRELAIKQEEVETRKEHEHARMAEMEAKKLAMASAAPAPSTSPDKTSKAGRGAKGERTAAAVEPAADSKSKGDGDALEIVNRPVRDKWALIVGISNFKNSKLNLHYPAKDAQDFYDFLTKEGNFAKDHVKLLVNEDATRANILSDLGDRWLPHVANPDDLVLIYISSHGSPADSDVRGVNYLLAYDSDPDTLFASGLPMQDLSNVIKTRVHSDRVVVVLDACHSGAAEAGGKGLVRTGNVDANAVAQGSGQLVISSSDPDQVSWESKNYQNSVFTRCLIEALRKNGNDTTLGEAFTSMKDKVQQQVLSDRGVLQTPVLRSSWKGNDLRISSPPAAPRIGL